MVAIIKEIKPLAAKAETKCSEVLTQILIGLGVVAGNVSSEVQQQKCIKTKEVFVQQMRRQVSHQDYG